MSRNVVLRPSGLTFAFTVSVVDAEGMPRDLSAATTLGRIRNERTRAVLAFTVWLVDGPGGVLGCSIAGEALEPGDHLVQVEATVANETEIVRQFTVECFERLELT